MLTEELISHLTLWPVAGLGVAVLHRGGFEVGVAMIHRVQVPILV